MIQIINGVYGHYLNGKVVPKDKNSAPFELSPEQEKRLVDARIAVYVGSTESAGSAGADEVKDQPESIKWVPEYSMENTVAELREIGKLCGLTFKVGTTKAEMVAALDKHIQEHTVEGVEVNEDGEISVADDDDAPNFDAADAVVE